MKIETSALEVATRYVGIKEVKGISDNPLVMAMLKLDNDWPDHDEVPWCSAFANWVAWNLGLSRSGSLSAKSWVNVGEYVSKHEAVPGLDIVVLNRGKDPRMGHVGFFHSYKPGSIGIVGGNQGDSVSLAYFGIDTVASVRRLIKA